MPKLFVGITSCHQNTVERQAIRDTWLKTWKDQIDYKFFIGLPKKRGGKRDEVYLDAPDTYAALPLKVYRMFKWFMQTAHYSHILKCDDDTFVHIPRLLDLNIRFEDYLGLRCAHFYCGGGPGYILSRNAIQELLKVPESEWAKQQHEDIAVGLFLQNKIPITPDKRFRHGFLEPAPTNDFITAHKCDIARLHRLNAQFA